MREFYKARITERGIYERVYCTQKSDLWHISNAKIIKTSTFFIVKNATTAKSYQISALKTPKIHFIQKNKIQPFQLYKFHSNLQNSYLQVTVKTHTLSSFISWTTFWKRNGTKEDSNKKKERLHCKQQKRKMKASACFCRFLSFSPLHLSSNQKDEFNAKILGICVVFLLLVD
jgi:hypothetical protein